MKNKQYNSKKGKTDKLIKDILRDKQLYLFLVLPVVYIIIFAYLPMGGLIIAFKDYSMRKGIWGSEWVGLKHFIRFFDSYYCVRIIRNTIVLAVYQLIAGFPIPICFALLVNSLNRGKFQKVAQSIVNLPYFISVTVMVGILFQIMDSRYGLYGNIMQKLTGSYPMDLFGNAKSFRHLYVWSGVWQNMGYSAIIYIAALSGVDTSLHEAAEIDGASRIQRIWYIDLPSILPTATIMLILAVGQLMNVGYEKVLLMQNDLNLNYSEIISTYVYKVGLASGITNFSLSAAISMFNSVINFILLLSVNKITKKLSGSGIF